MFAIRQDGVENRDKVYWVLHNLLSSFEDVCSFC